MHWREGLAWAAARALARVASAEALARGIGFGCGTGTGAREWLRLRHWRKVAAAGAMEMAMHNQDGRGTVTPNVAQKEPAVHAAVVW